ncbi:hypothetical protein FGM00_18330 [Aggregatimonas sangjinii]|uniref:Phage holin family protein n=1 Tax=Aggregatimonas sangjinii TaxID=2583587 RepID=A0A5B7STN8_9FLAO|nr:hypothetical protein [Aggregatimonas sangjinii]QCX01976.1 hypothetical protein FGM00_18330 [Aggregatimonas sangjinii]
MSVFESLNETSNKAVDVGEQYYKKTQEYYKLKVFQVLSISMGMLFKAAIIGSLLLIGLILLIVAATMSLGEYLGDNVQACIIIAVILVLLGFILFLLRTKFDNFVIKKLSEKFFVK